MTAYSNIKGMKSWSLLMLLVIGGLLSPKSLLAQDSLSHYLVRSAQNNLTLKSSYNQYLASLEMIQQVGSLPDPDMTFGVFIKPKGELMGNQNADIKFMQMFPWFGTLTAAKSEAALMAKARFQEFSEARNKLFYDLTAIYYQIYRLEKEKSLAEKNLKYLKTYEQLSLIRFRTSGTATSGSGNQSGTPPTTGNNNSGAPGGGMGNQPQQGMGNQPSSSGGGMAQSSAPMSKGKGIVDVLGVQLDINDLESSLAFLSDQKKPLVASFNAYLNRPLNSVIYIPDTLITIKIDTTLSVLTDSIVSANPMLKMYAAEQESYKAKIEKSRLMGLPMFGFGVDYMLLSKRAGVMGPDNGNDMIMPMLNLTLPIYRKKYDAMRKEAEYMMKASKDKQSNMNNNLRVDLENVLLNLTNSERKINLYKQQTVLAGQSLNVQTATYSSAGIDMEEVLRMQQKLLDYQYKLVEAIVEQNTQVANIGYLVSKRVVSDDYLKSNNE
jgi:outer membrane protein TolC